MSATLAPQHKLCESPDCPACAPDPLATTVAALMVAHPTLDQWQATRWALAHLERAS